MALRVIEGFESFGASGTTGSDLENALKAKYGDANIDTATDCTITTGWGSGLGIQSNYESSTVSNYITFTFDAQTTWIVGFAFQAPATLATTCDLLNFRTNASILVFELNLTPDFKLKLVGGETWYSTRVLKPSTWYYIECKIFFNDSTGTINLNINGIADITKTGVDTIFSGSNTAAIVQLDLSCGVGSIVDDLYIADGQAGVNTFQGPCKIENLVPTSDDTVAWVPSTGVDNYALIDEAGPNALDYITGVNINDSDLYGYEDLSSITGGIAGIQLNTAAQLDTTGSRLLVDTISSNGTVSSGAGVSLASNNYETIFRLLESDPDANSSWTPTTINAIKAGVKVGD